MITTNVYMRVFQIKVNNSTGTCFTIDIDGRQYVVTARHVIDGWKPSDDVLIYHENQWKKIELSLVGRCDGEIDIAVLSSPFQLSPVFDLPATAGGIVLGQDVYFLGFPYGWYGDIGEMNRNFPMPFIKKAILSCTYFQGGIHHLFLDGHNNPGFSGGPVVFKEPNRKNEFKIASVISGYRYTNEPIFAGETQIPMAAYRYNTGIIVTYSIKHAVDLIKANPIGLPIKL